MYPSLFLNGRVQYDENFAAISIKSSDCIEPSFTGLHVCLHIYAFVNVYINICASMYVCSMCMHVSMYVRVCSSCVCI